MHRSYIDNKWQAALDHKTLQSEHELRRELEVEQDRVGCVYLHVCKYIKMCVIHTHSHGHTHMHTRTLCARMHIRCTTLNTLQRTATHCNALQRTATHCNTLQHVHTLHDLLNVCCLSMCVSSCVYMHVYLCASTCLYMCVYLYVS